MWALVRYAVDAERVHTKWRKSREKRDQEFMNEYETQNFCVLKLNE